MDTDNKTNNLLLDIDSNKVFSYFKNSSGNHWSVKTLYGNPIESLNQILDNLGSQISQTKVTLGHLGDPFLPFQNKFHFATGAIELLCNSNLAELKIQTRSPLILFVQHLLGKIKNKSAVTFAIEAIDDETNYFFTPELPKPSERLSAAKALVESGIKVEFQYSPVFKHRIEKKDAKQAINRLLALSQEIQIVGSTKLRQRSASFNSLLKFWNSNKNLPLNNYAVNLIKREYEKSLDFEVVASVDIIDEVDNIIAA